MGCIQSDSFIQSPSPSSSSSSSSTRRNFQVDQTPPQRPRTERSLRDEADKKRIAAEQYQLQQLQQQVQLQPFTALNALEPENSAGLVASSPPTSDSDYAASSSSSSSSSSSISAALPNQLHSVLTINNDLISAPSSRAASPRSHLPPYFQSFSSSSDVISTAFNSSSSASIMSTLVMSSQMTSNQNSNRPSITSTATSPASSPPQSRSTSPHRARATILQTLAHDNFVHEVKAASRSPSPVSSPSVSLRSIITPFSSISPSQAASPPTSEPNSPRYVFVSSSQPNVTMATAPVYHASNTSSKLHLHLLTIPSTNNKGSCSQPVSRDTSPVHQARRQSTPAIVVA